MATQRTNSNDVGIERRLGFCTDLVTKTLSFNLRHIEAIAYEKNFPFPYNNFVYFVQVEPLASLRLLLEQHGVQEVPSGLSKFVLRLPNPLSGYNDNVRVENEVASLNLARAAIQPKLPNIVPRVFGWASASNGKQGWILQEHMLGKNLLADFPKLKLDDQQLLLGQMADVLKCLQQYRLPRSVDAFGGLTFNEAGDIVSAPMSILDGGPFSSYDALVIGTVQSKLAKADLDPRIEGWRGGGLRARVDRFVADGVALTMKSVTEREKKLVHADLSPDNLLYDPATLRLTGVIDFDFSHVGTVADDFFRSLGHGVGRFPDPRDGQETLALNKAMLEGFPDPTPSATDDIQWPIARAWDNALRERDMFRPGNIPGMQQLSGLFWLSSQILPFKLANEVVVGNSTEEQLSRRKEEGERLLGGFLEDHGY